jgi:hypothetical protein
MQTFVPYPNIQKTALCLDDKRLGKQRVECFQILNTLHKRAYTPSDVYFSWKNHPAVLMWEGYEGFLNVYSIAMCEEWKKRGFKDSISEKFQAPITYEKPWWWGEKELHLSHQSKLLSKKYDHYTNFFSEVTPNLEYIWPIRSRKGIVKVYSF